MKKYTLRDLTIMVTGAKETEIYWESEYQQIRRINKVIKRLTGTLEINDTNIDKYIKICKELYEYKEKMAIVNRYCKILDSIEVEDKIMRVPYLPKELTEEELLVIYAVILPFFEGTDFGDYIEGIIIRKTSEEYNQMINEFEKEVERIKYSIEGYDYYEKIEKMKQLVEYLKSQRVEIDEKILARLDIK